MGACSSKPKTAEFEGSMDFHSQEEIAKKNLDNDQKSEFDAVLKSIEPKTLEFEGSMNFDILQAKMARKILGEDQESGCDAGVKSVDLEQKFFFQCPLAQNLHPRMENNHSGMGDLVLQSEKEYLAGSGPQNSKKETCATAEGICDAKHCFVAEGESQVPEIGAHNAKVNSVVQQLYEELAVAQNEDVLGSLTDLVIHDEEVVVVLPQKVGFGDVENRKFQTVGNINEDKESLSFEGKEPGIDAEKGSPTSNRAMQETIFLASGVSKVDLKLKINPDIDISNYETGNRATCSASRAANGTKMLHNGKNRNSILEDPSELERIVHGAQRHDFEEALEEQSVPLIYDSKLKNLNVMLMPSNGLLDVKENDVPCVTPSALISLPEASALSNGNLMVVGIKVDEFACIDILPSKLKSTEKGADKQVEEAHLATSMCDELQCHVPKLNVRCTASTDQRLEVHETQKPLIGLLNTKVNGDSMACNLGDGVSDMISSKDARHVGLAKGRTDAFLVADINESIFREALDSQTSGLSKVHKESDCSIQEEDFASKQKHDNIFCPDELKVFKFVDMGKEQAIHYKRHSAMASRSSQGFQELSFIDGKDMASDIDEVLEKLASEFERQESLSSFVR